MAINNLVASANVAKSATITRTSNHSAPITGTFRLLVGGTPLTVSGSTSIASNVWEGSLESALNAVYGSREIRVRRVMGTRSNDVIDFIIEYVGISGPAQTLTLETVTLSGGRAGTNPTGVASTPRPFSANPFYSPIPFEFLRVPSTDASI